MSLSITIPRCSDEKLEGRRKLNENLEQVTNAQTHWFDAPSAAEYRRWRREGLNGYPTPFRHPKAYQIEIPSNHGHHFIPLRVIPPEGVAKGVYLHFHAGGFVIGSAASHDAMLARIAGEFSLIVVSVEYRLAPEHIFPAASDDCLDAALFALSDSGVAKLGGKVHVIAGESAGAYLTVLTAIQLRDQGIDVRQHVKAIVPNCGIFDLTYTPSTRSHKKRIIMGWKDTTKFIDTYLPLDEFPLERRKQGDISPLYADLTGLPPSLFLCGTTDPLLDDSVFMASKYHMAGNTTLLELVAEGFHGFTLFPVGEVAEEGISKVIQFLKQYL